MPRLLGPYPQSALVRVKNLDLRTLANLIADLSVSYRFMPCTSETKRSATISFPSPEPDFSPKDQ